MEQALLEKIIAKVKQNRNLPVEQSYSATILKHRKGINKILEKIGEEATELVIAAKDGKKPEILNEMADLWFHSLLLLVHYDYSLEELMKILQDRHESPHTERPRSEQ